MTNLSIKKIFFREVKPNWGVLTLSVAIFDLGAMISDAAALNHKTIVAIIFPRLFQFLSLNLMIFVVKQVLKFTKRQKYPIYIWQLIGVISVFVSILTLRISFVQFEVEQIPIRSQTILGFIQGLIWFPILLVLAEQQLKILDFIQSFEKTLVYKARREITGGTIGIEIKEKAKKQIKNRIDSAIQIFLEKFNVILENKSNREIETKEILNLLKSNEFRGILQTLEAENLKLKNNSQRRNLSVNLRISIKEYVKLFVSIRDLFPIKGRTFLIIELFLVSPAYLRFLDFPHAALNIALIAVYTLTLSFSLLRIEKLRLRYRNLIRFLIIYLMGCAPFVVNRFLFFQFDFPDTTFPIVFMILLVPLSFVTIMNLVQFLEFTKLTKTQIDNLEPSNELKEIALEQVREEIQYLERYKWSLFLHGNVLTRLMASSLRLQLSETNIDLKLYADSIKQIREFVSSASVIPDRSGNSLIQEMNLKEEPWRGIVQISFEIEERIKNADGDFVNIIGDIVEEAVSNSVRHGNANRILVRVNSRGDRKFEIDIIDNASTPFPESVTRIGLGSNMFNLHTNGRWSAQNFAGGTYFHFLIQRNLVI